MAAERIPERNEIPVEFTWDLTDIFKSDEDWLREYEALMQVPEQLAEYEGTLGESAARLLEYMQLDDEVSVRLEKLMGYAGCKADQDTADSRYQDMRSKGVGCCVMISGAASFATPELIAIPEETLDAFYRECPELETYRRNLYRLRRRAEGIRESRGEETQALLSLAAQLEEKKEVWQHGGRA